MGASISAMTAAGASSVVYTITPVSNAGGVREPRPVRLLRMDGVRAPTRTDAEYRGAIIDARVA
jgi:hypothetical protein